jgi:hypothetical protein
MSARRSAVGFAVFLIVSPLFAQQDPRVEQLEKRLEDLVRQVDQIRQELDALKGAPPPDEPSSLADVQPLENIVAPAAAKALNPDISVIGTFLGHAGQRNEFEPRDPIAFDEAEVAYEAFIDPYARGRFFIALGPDEIELEEGYAHFIALPYGITAKAGKAKAMFGKANLWHNHTRPWVDQPLMLQRFFGGEGLADVGISVSKAIDVPGVFVEATGEVFSGDVEDVFGRQANNDLFFNTHLKAFRDISESTNIEIGTSYARGTLPDDGRHNHFAGLDVTYRWKPLQQSTYRAFIARFEGVVNRRDDVDDNLLGFFASADYQLARRWFAGVRIDHADRAEPRVTDRGVSATVTFRPSEFSQLRGQFRRSDFEGLKAVNEFLIQLQFAIGAHGAHTF